MSLYQRFDEERSPELTEVGGKGKALIETTQRGFQVPEGFVLTVEFFSPWLKKVQKTKAWKNFISVSESLSSGESSCDLDSLHCLCNSIRDECKNLSLLPQQNEALRKGIQECFPAYFSGNSDKSLIVAVRSSSPEEDLDGKSFAGGYETMLGIRIERDLTENEGSDLHCAILHCFASAFDDRIVQYKLQQHMSVVFPRIALVIQRQIRSEISGVAFSLNPLNNCFDEVVINSNHGLGETVVGGDVTPDHYVVDKVEDCILEKKIAAKGVSLWLTENENGVELVEQKNEGDELNKTSSLTDEQVLQVSRLVSMIEEDYEKPMDIEWAIESGKLYLLQSRPITTYVPIHPELLTKPGEEKYLYMEGNQCWQGLKDPCSNLGMDLFITLNTTQGTLKDILTSLHGRHYLNISYFSKALGKRAMKANLSKFTERSILKIFKDENLLDRYSVSKLPSNFKYRKLEVAKAASRSASTFALGLTKPKKAQRKYDKVSEKTRLSLKRDPGETVSFTDALDEKVKAYRKFFKAHCLLLLPMIADYRLRRMFKNVKTSKELIDYLHMDLPGNPTNKMARLMYRLATFPEIQNTTSMEILAKKIKNRECSKEFLDLYDEFMDRFGCRVIKEIDIAEPRHYENPEELLKQLKSIDVSVSTDKSTDIARKKAFAYKLLSYKAKEMGKEKKFKQLAGLLDSMMGQREVIKYLWVTTIASMRKVALRIGAEWVKEGRLDHVEQIFDLTLEQVKKAEQSPINLRRAIALNMRPRKLVEHVKDWPVCFDSRGKFIRAPPEFQDGAYVGSPISAGKVRGIARILKEPFEKPLMKGEILVTHCTNPCWSPVFINAAAVVLELGSPLSHGAIIAREYGLPCVSGLENAVTLIKDGQLIEVDGTNGTVRILDEGSQESVVTASSEQDSRELVTSFSDLVREGEIMEAGYVSSSSDDGESDDNDLEFYLKDSLDTDGTNETLSTFSFSNEDEEEKKEHDNETLSPVPDQDLVMRKRLSPNVRDSAFLIKDISLHSSNAFVCDEI